MGQMCSRQDGSGQPPSPARYVYYDLPITIYSNFGIGGRFLVPAASRRKVVKKVEWLDLPLPERGVGGGKGEPYERPWHWILRCQGLPQADDEARGPRPVLLGDMFSIESCMYPGHFLQFSDGLIVLQEGLAPSGEFQVRCLESVRAGEVGT
jgi:hypothetical protein